MLQVHSLKELIFHARSKSPFYKELYEAVPQEMYTLSKLPIINRTRFCTANNYYNNKLLTDPMHSGTVFKSGGTTGYPKYSFFSKVEWETFTMLFGQRLADAGLDSGDRVANLFYAGDLYAAFIFYRDAMDCCARSLLQFPIGGFTPAEEMIKMISEFEINVLLGVPTTMIELADELHRHKEKLFSVEKILYGGEVLFSDQKEYISEVMPNVKMSSIGYGSVDAGHLGYADSSCAPNEHRVFSGSTIMEIVDEETGKIIDEINKPGKLVYTNLTRLLMPIIRYPVGDLGIWKEDAHVKERKFQLIGRTEDGARLNNVTIGRQDLAEILVKYRKELSISNFQLTITHDDTKDRLTIHLATDRDQDELSSYSKEIVSKLYKSHPQLYQLVKRKKIHPIEIVWTSAHKLKRNPRTGKLYLFNDERGLVKSS
jgi:phenylacetate-CoA ligase